MFQANVCVCSEGDFCFDVWQEVGFALFWKSGISLGRGIISCENEGWG